MFTCNTNNVFFLFDNFKHQVDEVRVVYWVGLNTDSILQSSYKFIR